MFHDQSVIFIDAGFLLSAGSSTVTGTSLRAATRVDAEQLISGIVSITRDNCNLDPLRIYWYDASRDGVLSDWHKKISLLDDVKVRLGRIGVNGQQKGVDLRLGLDLVEVARNGSAKVAYLLSGDDDLAEAVEAAQDLGMKVVLLALEDKNRYLGIKSVAEHLAYKVDRIIVLPQDLIHSTFTPATRAVVPGAEAGTESEFQSTAQPAPSAPPGPMPGAGPGAAPVTPATLASKKATFITVKEPEVDLPTCSQWRKRWPRAWPATGTRPLRCPRYSPSWKRGPSSPPRSIPLCCVIARLGSANRTPTCSPCGNTCVSASGTPSTHWPDAAVL